jgi:predicted TIM-barrel fold metal-dependent hydrolase
MLIADAQVHLWGADSPSRPWPPGEAHRAQKPHPVTKDMALAGMKEAGVDRVVVVPPSWEGDRNDLALEAARLHPDRFAVMGRLALEKPESRTLVDGWKRQPGMLGMRFTFSTERQRPWLTDGTADWLWIAAERAGIPVMMSVAGSFAAVDRIAERHPGLRIVVDHLGIRSGSKGPEAFAGLPELCTLAPRANVAVKASALPCYSAEGYPFPRRPRTHPSGVRRLRSAADVLGDGLDAAPVPVASSGNAVHRRVAVALRARPGVDHGPGPLRVAGLAPSPYGLITSRQYAPYRARAPLKTGFSVRSMRASAPSVGSISA